MAQVSNVTIDSNSVRTVIDGLTEVETRLKEALRILTDTAGKKMREWAQTNATWENRTGNARQGIGEKTYWEDDTTLTLAIFHQMEYGVWLELAHERKYAILEQAIESQREELMRAYKRLVGDV